MLLSMLSWMPLLLLSWMPLKMLLEWGGAAHHPNVHHFPLPERGSMD
jgi:hypothetical protein